MNTRMYTHTVYIHVQTVVNDWLLLPVHAADSVPESRGVGLGVSETWHSSAEFSRTVSNFFHPHTVQQKPIESWKTKRCGQLKPMMNSNRAKQSFAKAV